MATKKKTKKAEDVEIANADKVEATMRIRIIAPQVTLYADPGSPAVIETAEDGTEKVVKEAVAPSDPFRFNESRDIPESRARAYIAQELCAEDKGEE